MERNGRKASGVGDRLALLQTGSMSALLVDMSVQVVETRLRCHGRHAPPRRAGKIMTVHSISIDVVDGEMSTEHKHLDRHMFLLASCGRGAVMVS